jgi:hypothetical protein
MFDMFDVQEILQKKEDLHPELQAHLCHLPSGVPCIKHPLIYSIFHLDNHNALTNKRYEIIKADVQDALEQKDISRYVFRHERPYRLNAFDRAISFLNLKISNKDYWELLGSIWTDTENSWQELELWKYHFSSDRPCSEYLMNKQERKAFKNLPDKLTIYRGYVPNKNKNGLSYTLDETTANWFSNRYNKSNTKDGKVLKRIVNKSDVLAYFNGRNEEEILIKPKF